MNYLKKINVEKIKQLFFNKYFLLLLIIFFIGYFLRVFKLWDNLIFAYDQARDGQRIYDMIFSRDIKIVGPETDIPGVFNGPLFYYLLVPIYFIFHFDPNYASLFFILINLSVILLLFALSIILFKNKSVGTIAALLWALSYQQANFAKFISNASPMGISSIIFFLGLAIYIFKKNSLGLTISVLGLATATHFNFYLIYLSIFYFVFYFVFYPKIKVKDLVFNTVLLIILLSPFLIAEIKWKLLAAKSFALYFNKQSDLIFIAGNLSIYLQRMSENLYYSFFSFNNFLALLLFFFFLFIIWKYEKNRGQYIFLLIWSFSTLPLFAFSSGVINGSVINSSIFGATTLVAGLGLYHLFNQKKLIPIAILLILLFFISNFNLYSKEKFKNVKLFALQPLMLSEEKEVIKYTYSNSSKKDDFSICAVTNPLFINTLWSYLYKIYGERTYGYLPYWSGQIQYLNKSFLPYDVNHTKTRYLIIEPSGGMPDFAIKATVYLEDYVSMLEETKKFGEIIVQKRRLFNKEDKFRDTQNLPPEIISTINLVNKSDPRYSCFNGY